MTELKRCSHCGQEKPLTEFYAKRPDCKDCVRKRIKKNREQNVERERARNRDYFRKNKEKIQAYQAEYRALPKNRKKARERTRLWIAANKEYAKDYDLKRMYGLENGEYERMLSKQGGKCAICQSDKPGGKRKDTRFHVDHCHETGYIRGLLCTHCNLGIGQLQHSVPILESAIKYLKNQE